MLAWRTFVRSSNSLSNCTKYEGTPRCPPPGWGNRLVRSPVRCSDVRIGGWRPTATPAILLPFILNQQGSLTYTIMVMIMNTIPFLHSAYSAVFLRSNCVLWKRGTYLEQKVKIKMLPQLKDHHWTITFLQLCRKDRKYVLKRIQHNSGICLNQLKRLLVLHFVGRALI